MTTQVEHLDASDTPDTHPAADAYPAMSDLEFAQLKEDIRSRGQLLPVEIYGELLLDGRHRWRACAELGIEVRAVRFTGTEEEAISRVASLNGTRRNLTPSQVARAALELERLYAEALAKAKIVKCADAGRSHEGTPKGLSSKAVEKVLPILVEPLPPKPKAPTAAELAAKATGASKSYVIEAKRILRERPDLDPLIRDGKLTIPEAKRIAFPKAPPAPIEGKGAEAKVDDAPPPVSHSRNDRAECEMGVRYVQARTAWKAVPQANKRAALRVLDTILTTLDEREMRVFATWARATMTRGRCRSRVRSLEKAAAR
ncbi:MAG TPA: ParB N-terminal domain-containing protein [Polyangiaceae bacterium]|nr:ParB N-terminal domain-containing protein [Polyangiaceae bacterium]